MQATTLYAGDAFSVYAYRCAAAQASVTPFVGSSFGADAPKTKLATGFAVTYMGRFAGIEVRGSMTR